MSDARNILIVEDEPLIAMMLEDFLLSLGHEVRATCESVGEALKAVQAADFDLAILDVNLRGEAVFPLADELLARDLPVILLTGYQQTDLPERFRGTTHLPKPYDPQILARALDRFGAS